MSQLELWSSLLGERKRRSGPRPFRIVDRVCLLLFGLLWLPSRLRIVSNIASFLRSRPRSSVSITSIFGLGSRSSASITSIFRPGSCSTFSLTWSRSSVSGTPSGRPPSPGSGSRPISSSIARAFLFSRGRTRFWMSLRTAILSRWRIAEIWRNCE